MRLTAREFQRQVEGAGERLRQAEDLLAWHIGWTVAPHVKTPPRVDRILGRASTADRRQAQRLKRRKRKERER